MLRTRALGLVSPLCTPLTSVRSLGWVEDSIGGSCAPPDLGRVEASIAGSWVFVISKKLNCALVIPFATKGAVLAVEAFTFCVGLAWLARCVLPHIDAPGSVLVMIIYMQLNTHVTNPKPCPWAQAATWLTFLRLG